MEPAEATRAARILLDHFVMHPNDRHVLGHAWEALAARVAPAETARALTSALGRAATPYFRNWLTADLGRATLGLFSDMRPLARIASARAGAFATPHNVLPALPLLHPHSYPHVQPLPPQELVELLKHPFCIGEARRAVLDALELTYQRSFADQWEFVAYAEKHQPELDLLTPPKRSDPKP
jgi:hypothetical protein